MIQVIARLTFTTHEEWWAWEQARQRAGWEIMQCKDGPYDCEEIILEEAS